MFSKPSNPHVNLGSSACSNSGSHSAAAGIILPAVRRISRIVLMLLLLSGPVRATEVVTVLADQSLGSFEAPVGLLHGIDHKLIAPDRDLMTDLHPKHWRVGKYETYEEVANYDGVQITYQVEAPMAWNVGYENMKPWDDWPAYAAYVRSIVQSRSAWFPDHPVAYWDVWNEPDNLGFWTGTRDQLLQLFALTYNTIKAEDPTAQVIGPSFSCYNPDLSGLQNMIDFLVDLDTQYGVRLDAISWHELGSACTGFGPRPWNVYLHAEALRADLAAHFGPAYNPPLQINEYGAKPVHLSPGWNVGYLYYIIHSGVDAAVRSCWELCEEYESPLFAYGNCFAGQNGLFTYHGDTPQAIYWVYKAVADMEGEEQLATQGLPTTNIIASRNDSSENIRILLGRHLYEGNPGDVSVQVQGYPFPYQEVHVQIRRIPNSWAECDAAGTLIPKTNVLPAGPAYVSTTSATVVDGAFNIDVADFADADAYVLMISPRRFIPAMSSRGLTALGLLLGSIGTVLAYRTR
jgi:hypothetical protein